MAHPLRLLSCTCAAALIPVAAMAQEDGIADAFLLDTIVITGELQSRSLQDSPTSAAIVTGEEIERTGDVDIYDTLERIPGVTSSFGDNGFAIRGIDQRSVGGGGNGLTVSTQVDGIALPSNQATFEGPFSTWDLAQVEVLRGPQSTQQGRNALAGAIIIRSNDPTFEEEFKVRVGVGTENLRSVALVANTPLIEDRLAFRFSAERIESDGFVTNTFLGTDADPLSDQTYRAKLLWTPTADFEAILSFSFSRNSDGENTILGTTIPPEQTININVPTSRVSYHRTIGLRTIWDISEVFTLETETSFYNFDQPGILDRDYQPVEDGNRDQLEKSDSFEQDVRLSFDIGRYSGVVGFFYTDLTNTRSGIDVLDAGFASGFPILSFFDVVVDTNDPTEIRNYAVFGEVDIQADELLEGLRFTVGGRFDREDLRFRGTQTFDPPNIPGFSNSALDVDTSYTAFLPKLGVTYEFLPQQSVSFTVQEGYRSGGAGASFGQFFEFEPEFTTNYEIAYRGTFMEDRLTVAANLFYTDWTDQQVQQTVQVSPVQAITSVVNAGSSRLWGGELSVQSQTTDRLSLFGAVAYTNTRFKDFQTGQQDFSGKEFPLAPRWTASVGGNYDWDNGVSLGMTASYQSEQFTSAANDLTIDSRLLVDATLTYDNGDWLVGLYGRNLLDREYVSTRSVLTFGVGDALTVGDPRTFGVFVQRSF